MLSKPRLQTTTPENTSSQNTAATTLEPKPALLGMRGSMILLAVAPVALAGAAVLFSVYNTVPASIDHLYETQTNQMVRVLAGNIDFTNPPEIEREFRQAMNSTTIIAMNLTQVGVDRQRHNQMIYRDAQAKAVFERREPGYLKAISQGPDAETEYFANFNFQNTDTNNWVLRGTGHGGKYGATDIKMFGLNDTGRLEIPQATANESGFGLIVIDDQEVADGQRRSVGLMAVMAIVAALIVATIGAVVFAQSLVRPIVKLTKLADAMSIGDLETPIEIGSRNELGALGRALERTRQSLRLALARTQRKRAERD